MLSSTSFTSHRHPIIPEPEHPASNTEKREIETHPIIVLIQKLGYDRLVLREGLLQVRVGIARHPKRRRLDVVRVHVESTLDDKVNMRYI
jgi:hypothetical protein